MTPVSFLYQPSGRVTRRICILPFWVIALSSPTVSSSLAFSSEMPRLSVGMERALATRATTKAASMTSGLPATPSLSPAKSCSSPKRPLMPFSTIIFLAIFLTRMRRERRLSSAPNCMPRNMESICWFSRNSASRAAGLVKSAKSPSCRQACSISSPLSAFCRSQEISTRRRNQCSIRGRSSSTLISSRGQRENSVSSLA